jgi:RNA recognition motif-containing protein
MVLKRLFIGNLPENVTSEEVSSKFSHFGNVQDAEVRTKNEATFAFVSLFVEEEASVKHCKSVLN